MNGRNWRFLVGALAVLLQAPATAAPAAAPAVPQRYIVEPTTPGDYEALRADITAGGGKVVRDMRSVNLMVVTLPARPRAEVMLEKNVRVGAKAKDGVRRLIKPSLQRDLWGKPFSAWPQQTRIQLDGSGLTTASPNGVPAVPDPAYALPGLLWNLDRINAPNAWATLTTGLPTVRVAVNDTGVDYGHSELVGKVEGVEDFTGLEAPYPICQYFLGGTTDAALATSLGGPADSDYNGHGTWIAGNIAANLDGVGINGVAPDVMLWSFKISQYCGSAYDSEIIASFLAAADHVPKIDIVSISFGGYLNRRDPQDAALYNQYVRVVDYARTKGVVIVAAAGNEHTRIGSGGQVLSHGTLTVPGDTLADYYGLYEVPGGIPGVVMVSATGNSVNATSPSCIDAEMNNANATCKPNSDRHRPFGVGKQNQLTYYSNYGPRVDVTAPGGARKFNLPSADRGGTPGFPVTDSDGTAAWEDFSITSNFALEIPCYTFSGAGIPPLFYPSECYSTIQGTSMATPHASAVLALIASVRPDARYVPDRLIYLLKGSTQRLRVNATPPLSATDRTAGDLTGVLCLSGYCHLGGSAISASEAFGAGLVQAPSLVP